MTPGLSSEVEDTLGLVDKEWGWLLFAWVAASIDREDPDRAAWIWS